MPIVRVKVVAPELPSAMETVILFQEAGLAIGAECKMAREEAQYWRRAGLVEILGHAEQAGNPMDGVVTVLNRTGVMGACPHIARADMALK